MTMTAMILLGFGLLAAIITLEILLDSWRSGRAFCIPLPRRYRDRQSQKDAWQHRYVAEALDDISAVLQTLCHAFSFNPDCRYQFAPDDRLLEVYRDRYPRWKFWLAADSMEIESMSIGLREKYGIDTSSWNENTTLGEIIDSVLWTETKR